MITLLTHLYKSRRRASPEADSTPSSSNAPPDAKGNADSATKSPEKNESAPSADKPQSAPTNIEDKPTMRWRLTLLAALAFPVILETLDYTVVATAQTHIASIFKRLDLQSYIGTSYLLTSTVFLPLFSSVADIYGRHAAIQLSLIFFIFGSALSTGARNMEMMLAGRGIAGVGAAGLIVAVRVILVDSGSLKNTNWQTSMLFFLYALGYSVGPVIGGFLVAANFRWVFAINLPCCSLASVICFFLLRGKVKGGLPPEHEGVQDTRVRKLLRMDWVGASLFIGAGILVLLALNWGSTETWHSTKVIVGFCVGGFLFLLCLVWELFLEKSFRYRHSMFWPDPMLPMEVFRSLDVCITCYSSFCMGMVTLVMFYFVAIFLTIVRNLSPAKSGAQLIYFAPGLGGGTLIAIRLVAVLKQPKYPIILGGIIVTVALGLVSLGMNENNQNLVNGFLAMAGVGVGMSFGPLAIQGRYVLAARRAAIVTALQLFFRTFGGTVGLAQCGAILNSKVRSYIISQVISGALPPQALASLSVTSGLSSLQNINSLPQEVQVVVRTAFRIGTRWSFISLIPWCGLATIVTCFLSDIKDETETEQEPTQPEEKKQDAPLQTEKREGQIENV